jgi:CRP-like cAMP-binding protein
MLPEREVARLLAGVDLFEDLPPKLLTEVARAAKVVEHDDGAVVMRERESGYALHVIVDGAAVVTVGGAARSRLEKGCCFGELSLIDDRPRSATVTAEGGLRTVTLTKPAFRGLLLEPEFAHRVMVGLTTRLRAAEAAPAHA